MNQIPELTPEAMKKRKARCAARRASVDPLAERARLIALWKSSPWHKGNKCWWYPFKLQKCYRRLLMPKLRAFLDARDQAREDRYAAEAKEAQRQWIQKKADQQAAKARANSPQVDMLDRLEKRA